MQKYPKTKSNVQPEPLSIDDFSVWVAQNITEVDEPDIDEQTGFKGYEYDLIQYEKNEYILSMAEKNTQLEETLTDTQVALCEIYEGLGV
jgi:hypothetical protein